MKLENTKSIRLGMIACSALLLAACATMGRQIDPAAFAQVKQGVTTKQQAMEILGKPSAISNESDGGTTYSYTYAKANAHPLAFVPILGLFFMNTDVQSESYTIRFNAKGVVTNTSSTSASSSL